MIFSGAPKNCKGPQRGRFKTCPSDNMCKDKQQCVPSKSSVDNCLSKLQTTGNLPDSCICVNHEIDFATTDLYIHNNTMDTLQLVDFTGDNVICPISFSQCPTVIRTDFAVDKKCQIGRWIYPDGVLEPPKTIGPKSSIYLRSYSGQFGHTLDKGSNAVCGHDVWFHTNVTYQIKEDPSSNVQILTQRKRQGEGVLCNHHHKFDRLNSISATAKAKGNLKIESAKVVRPDGSSEEDKDKVEGSTFVVVIGGGSQGPIGCTGICPTGTICNDDTGQCIPQQSCRSSAGCTGDFYCSDQVCVFGCTETSNNCLPGKSCIDGVCKVPEPDNNERTKIILFVVIGIVLFIVIIGGIVYFIYESNG